MSNALEECRWWGWNMYPLASDAWPSERFSRNDVKPGHEFHKERTRVEHRSVSYVGNPRGWLEGETEPHNINVYQRFYRPSEDDKHTVRAVLGKDADADDPPWRIIEARLRIRFPNRQDFPALTAPTLIAILKESIMANDRPENDGARKRRVQIPQAIQDEVMAACRRRCALCFGLNRELQITLGQIDHIDDDPSNNELDNLVYLCPNHHAMRHSSTPLAKGVSSSEVKRYRSDLLAALSDPNTNQLNPAIGPVFNTNAGDHAIIVNNPGSIRYSAGHPKQPAPIVPGTLATDGARLSYVRYLIERYIACRRQGEKYGNERRQFRPESVHAIIKKKFGARVNLIQISRFEELVAHLQSSIDGTIVAKQRSSRQYVSFDEHLKRYNGE